MNTTPKPQHNTRQERLSRTKVRISKGRLANRRRRFERLKARVDRIVDRNYATKGRRFGKAPAADQPSPLPWRFDKRRLTIRSRDVIVADVCPPSWGNPDETTILDGHLIVEAVNNHTLLLSMVQAIANAQTQAELKAAVDECRRGIAKLPVGKPNFQAS